MSDNVDMAPSTEPGQTWTRRLLSPFAILLYVYFVYFAVAYSRLYAYVPIGLKNLGTRIVGFQPSAQTLGLYVWGAVVLILGFQMGTALAAWAGRRPIELDPGLQKVIARLGARLQKWRPVRSLGLGFALSLLGWGVALAANGSQVLASGAVSLISIATRWAQSPVLVWIAALQIIFVPALMVFASGRRQRVLAVAAFLVSVLALGLLGARNLPAKLIVSGFLAVVYVAKPKTIVRIAVALLVLLVLAMGVIGSVSKSGIYGASASTELAVALVYSDSVGTAYNLDRIVRITPPTGVYGGKLLVDSALAAVPGVDAEYANYQLGSYLQGRTSFTIDGERIDRSVSLAPTLLGAPYADWGVPGVAIQMLLLGALFGYLQTRSRDMLLMVPVLAAMASYVINGVNAGVHNPHGIIIIGLAVILVLGDLALYPRVTPASDAGKEV
ncbi:MAG: hypothetical protein RBS17_09150 [Coriobacteriia bacterium]|nr:hypothetical protein [Coriobacteriia bacterium]